MTLAQAFWKGSDELGVRFNFCFKLVSAQCEETVSVSGISLFL
jgi:hypothetical protein